MYESWLMQASIHKKPGTLKGINSLKTFLELTFK
jgi:hypothetical protein